MTGPRDPYVVLGVLPRATRQEIQRAFRRLVRQHHPDTSGGSGSPDELSAILSAYAAVRARDDEPAGPELDEVTGAERPMAQSPERPSSSGPSAFVRQPFATPPASATIRVGPVRWHRRSR
jgi:hypothetical protein